MFGEPFRDIDEDDYFFLEEAIYDRMHEEGDHSVFCDSDTANLRGL